MGRKIERSLLGLVIPLILGGLLPALHTMVEKHGNVSPNSSYSWGEILLLVGIQGLFAYLICRVVLYSKQVERASLFGLTVGAGVLTLVGLCAILIYGVKSFYLVISLGTYLYMNYFIRKKPL